MQPAACVQLTLVTACNLCARPCAVPSPAPSDACPLPPLPDPPSPPACVQAQQLSAHTVRVVLAGDSLHAPPDLLTGQVHPRPTLCTCFLLWIAGCQHPFCQAVSCLFFALLSRCLLAGPCVPP